MGLFNFTFSKEKELSKLDSELATAEEKVREVIGKIQRVKNAIQLAETEAMLEGTATAQKKVDKFIAGLEKLQKDQEKAQKEVDRLNAQYIEMKSSKNEEELEAVAEEDLERYKQAVKSKKLKDELERLIRYELEQIHNTSSFTPKGLLKEAGLNVGYFPEGHKMRSLWEEKRDQADIEINKEVAEAMDQIRKQF